MAFSILSQLSCFLVSSLILFANVVTYLFSLISPIPPLPLQPSELLIVITGCDSGFGELLSKRFSQKGFRVISGCLTLDGIKNLESVVTKAVLCDVTKEVDLQKLAQEVEDISKETNSKLWAVINNAGIADGGALDWTEVKIWKKVMEVNFFAIVGMIRTMLPFLKRTPGSRIINLSSLAGIVAGPGMGAYCASKHAVEGMAKALRSELKPWEIHVSNVNPGFMRTPILTRGVTSGQKTFDESPVDITSQYTREWSEELTKVMTQAAEDPILVVDSIEEAVFAKTPQMWYFPGKAASFVRAFPLCTSNVTDLYNSFISSKTTPQPTPEAFKRYRS